ncbi:ABC-type multidrug transport system ATPase component [Methanonatronarchaeum thermophilum]|uniref:ABC-type multidrug transport system ATPase component n=1 Tax=Methanonatronarchaeum thermophilum TaxID=1927129 RepID=A0A1Y3GDJ1_9EURY|nr:ABC transporter ATP-binding protein [Methanonatronarchaeum thermophilum]OUJ19532.1 ABC-type multidrug transport system ATPase component [Methanonatronarchaeum thermophilum]
MSVIFTDGLTKSYGDVLALEDLSIEVGEGEIFGFLGPNGSGKSTAINILFDLVRPSSGSASILGFDCQSDSVEVKKRTGFLPERCGIYSRLSGRKHIEFAIKSKGVNDDVEEVMKRVGILDAADRKAGGYSKGMKKRLCLGMALTGNPELIILDEPTSGLDPNGAREVRNIVLEERDRGATVFFSSHILDQVQRVCDRVAILKNGKLIAIDSIEGLRKEVGSKSGLRLVLEQTPTNLKEQLMAVDGVENVGIEGNKVVLTLEYEVSKNTVLEAVKESGAEVLDFETQEVTLEDLFASYISRKQN